MAPPYPVPDGPHNDRWKPLLRFATAIWDEISARHKIAVPLRIGGGSMLLRRYRHRRSWDLDLFVSDVRFVRWASPVHNAAAADLFPDHQEEATALKLVIGMQELDVIAAAPVFDPDAVEEAVLLDRAVLIERPREILAKKLIYRGRRLQPRDVFDFSTVAVEEPVEVAALVTVLPPVVIDGIAERLDAIAGSFITDVGKAVDPFPEFEPLLKTGLDIMRQTVAAWR